MNFLDDYKGSKSWFKNKKNTLRLKWRILKMFLAIVRGENKLIYGVKYEGKLQKKKLSFCTYCW